MRCELYEHIFSKNEEQKLICEKCQITYSQYLLDVEDHKNFYRFGKKLSS
jgi:hypothetical protein